MELQALRERAGVSQRELAKRTGLDQSLLSRFESGSRVPNAQQQALLRASLADPVVTARTMNRLDPYPSAPTDATARREFFAQRNALIASGARGAS